MTDRDKMAAAPRGRPVDPMGTISSILAAMAGCCLLALIGHATLDAVARHVTGAGVRGVVEYGEILLAALAMFGLAYAQRRDDHVSVEVVVSRLRPRPGAALELVGLVAVVVVLVWAVWASTGVALESVRVREVRFGIVEAPVWLGRLAVPLGLAALALEIVRRGIERLGFLQGSSDGER